MGRQSPGKWIRNLLLGKKSSSSSKSKSSREKDIYKPSSNKNVPAAAAYEASMSAPTPGANATKRVVSEKEVVVSVSSNDGAILSIGSDKQDNAQSPLANFGSVNHHEKNRLTETAIVVVQAAIRGYQARGKFKTLKGIIPLQAFIRGQLVRRQAISALYCVNSIVKFQALVRGYKVRHSDVGLAVQKIFKDTKFPNSIGVVASTQAAKLSDNIFVNKLLAPPPSAVSPNLKYNAAGEPKLAWEWLDRWTKSNFWEPLQELQKPDSMSDKKNGSCQTIQTNKGNVKRNAKKAPSVVRAGDDSISDSNKHKRYLKKDSNLPLHSAKELEKRSSKKTQTQNASDKSEVANEKRTENTRKVSGYATVNDVQEEDVSASAEKMKDLAVSKSKKSDLKKSLGEQAKEHENNESYNDTIAPLLHSSLMNGKDGGLIEDLNSENSKNFQRRASLPANFTDHENLLQNNNGNTPRRPSYMAATESTKAKLRGHGSPRSVSDLADTNSIITRRLSLSSSLNGKLGSFSPRSDRLAALSNKIRTDRSLSSSRDGTDKLIQPKWRR